MFSTSVEHMGRMELMREVERLRAVLAGEDAAAVERAARAIFDEGSFGSPGQDGYLQAYDEDAEYVYRPCARAILRAAGGDEVKRMAERE